MAIVASVHLFNGDNVPPRPDISAVINKALNFCHKNTFLILFVSPAPGKARPSACRLVEVFEESPDELTTVEFKNWHGFRVNILYTIRRSPKREHPFWKQMRMN